MILDNCSSIVHDRGMNFFKELVNGLGPLADHFGYENALNNKRKIVGELPCTGPV
jgi:hypothetical protein